MKQRCCDLCRQAVDDYKMACGLDPSDQALLSDLRALEAKLAASLAESPVPSQAANPAPSPAASPAHCTPLRPTGSTISPQPAALALEPLEKEPRTDPSAAVAREAVVAPAPGMAPGSAPSSAPGSSAAPSLDEALPLLAIAGLATRFAVLKQGAGAAVVAGSRVTVHAKGQLVAGGAAGSVFWDTRAPGQLPFTYQAGRGGVIAGWDRGCLGMKEGETRVLRIPSAEAYGASGHSEWGIPPNASLWFTLECLRVKAP